MLNTSVRSRSWLCPLYAWWSRFQYRFRRLASPALYPGVPRRFPIPPQQAHLYARAADEGG